MVENTATQPVSCKTFEQFISLLRANNQHAKTDGAFNSSGTGQNSAAAFVQLVLSNPSDAMGKAFELGWQVLFYKTINQLRGMDTPSTDEQLVQTCIQAACFYKGILLQLQQKYCVQLPIHIELDEYGRRAIADQVALVEPDQNARKEDVMAVVCNCFVKLGDCTRYLLDAKDKISASKEGMQLTASYYLAAQRVVPGQGQVYNQLGALMELWDGSGNGVCLGACMNFALASTAHQLTRSGSTNWLRCIGMHRNALHSFLKDHNLQKIVVKSMKFTMQVNVLSMTIIPLFGTGVDTVDLDKCDILWQAVHSVLKQLLQHDSWLKSAITRRPDEDVVMQAACHSCVCVWHAHQETISCSDQVDSMRKHTVFSQLAKALILMAASYTSALSDLLRKQATGSSQGAAAEPTPALVCATSRCLWALALLLHTIQECVVDHVIVQQYEEVDVLVKACVEMRCNFAVISDHIDVKVPVGREVFGCAFVRGCKVFAGLDVGQAEPPCDAQVPSSPEPCIHVLHRPAVAYSEVLCKLAQRLSAVNWHSGTASAGGCLNGVSEAIRQFTGQPGSEKQVLVPAEELVEKVSSGESQGDTDEGDEIVLVPTVKV